MPNLIKLTTFDFLHPTNDAEIEIDSSEIQSVASCKSGEGDDYTSIVMQNGLVYSVKESVSNVNEKIEEAEKASAEERNNSQAS